jgi:nucleoside-diphosphate-sugar epimerase
MSYSADPKIVISNVVAATLNILTVAARTRSVKGVVLTSSVTAACTAMPGGKGDGGMIVDVGR